MRILVDMDGIVVDLFESWFDAYAKLSNYKKQIQLSDVTTWGFEHLKQVERRKLLGLLARFNVFWNAGPLPGAVEGLGRLVDAGHEVLLVTDAPTSGAAKGKYEWVGCFLGKHGFTPQHLVMTAHKHLVIGDVLIDDKPSTIGTFVATGRGIWTIRYPYNVDACKLPGVEVMGDYTDTATAWENIVLRAGKAQ
jgi:5'(3')-deoxyribonucleotidase